MSTSREEITFNPTCVLKANDDKLDRQDMQDQGTDAKRCGVDDTVVKIQDIWIIAGDEARFCILHISSMRNLYNVDQMSSATIST